MIALLLSLTFFGLSLLPSADVQVAASYPSLGGTIMTDVQPYGPTGTWDMDWHDEFTADLANPDPAKWTKANWRVNGVTPTTGNMWTYGGKAVLQLSSPTLGAAIVATRHLLVGEVAEARIWFPGSAVRNNIYNFPAWWAAGVNYPEDGEIDIAEGLGTLAVSYWDGNKELRFKARPSGVWNDGYHRYTVQREEDRFKVYWDGELVGSNPTDDGGGPQRLILNVGYSSRFQVVTGRDSRVKIDYVRVWKRAA